MKEYSVITNRLHLIDFLKAKMSDYGISGAQCHDAAKEISAKIIEEYTEMKENIEKAVNEREDENAMKIEAFKKKISDLQLFKDSTTGLWATDRPDKVDDPSGIMFRIGHEGEEKPKFSPNIKEIGKAMCETLEKASEAMVKLNDGLEVDEIKSFVNCGEYVGKKSANKDFDDMVKRLEAIEDVPRDEMEDWNESDLLTVSIHYTESAIHALKFATKKSSDGQQILAQKASLEMIMHKLNVMREELK